MTTADEFGSSACFAAVSKTHDNGGAVTVTDQLLQIPAKMLKHQHQAQTGAAGMTREVFQGGLIEMICSRDHHDVPR